MHNTAARTVRIASAPAVALVAGLLITLLAQFVMDSLADSGDLFHWLQHALLFAGGLLAGGGVAGLARR